MEENYKIPGLLWEGLSIQQEKLQQNYVSQELARYKTKPNYLARLQHLRKSFSKYSENYTYDKITGNKPAGFKIRIYEKLNPKSTTSSNTRKHKST